MKKYFNIKLELDSNKVDKIIENAILKGIKGYVCSVERNVMSNANKSIQFQNIVNNALVNICDGNFVARCIGIAHKKNVSSYIGADLFIKYIEKGIYSQYFLGNTQEVLDGLKNKLSKIDKKIENMPFVTLPFKNVEDFNYIKIANDINKFKPDIIWISLGAPKQEYFMSKLSPYLNRGVLFGFGAIFNFYSGDKKSKRAPQFFLNLHLEWLYRMIQEPKKNFQRNWEFLIMVPRLISDERKKIKYLKK
jgi:N-acetylglucosaminyldiphosphoundecaprenol N-acetyl-beta-D-mannosaminyltransferase